MSAIPAKIWAEDIRFGHHFGSLFGDLGPQVDNILATKTHLLMRAIMVLDQIPGAWVLYVGPYAVLSGAQANHRRCQWNDLLNYPTRSRNLPQTEDNP